MILEKGQIVQFDTPFNILTRPANGFVHDLVGADDMVRQLSLLRVETAMTTVPQDYQPRSEYAIARHDNLRQALSLLLRTGAQNLTVMDAGNVVGVLDRKSGSAGMPRPISYAVFCLKKITKLPIFCLTFLLETSFTYVRLYLLVIRYSIANCSVLCCSYLLYNSCS